MSPRQLVEFSLNGRWQSLAVRPDESLLETLRNRCRILSTKDGCQPQGQCGCCLALIDGLPKVSCAVPTSRVQDKEILTLEGLPEEERRLIGRCFVAAAGLQCGYCIPGFALQAKHLLDHNPSPSRAEIARSINGHLC
ncbi:MAG: 2Fe-2S iron-sulfur cluster-binding protein, partial [Thermoanaerobaculia bacterium]